MPRLEIRTREVRPKGSIGVHLVTLEGFIDAATVSSFDTCLQKHSRSKSPAIVLDFGGVEYINSSGIGTVIKHHHQAIERGGELVVANVPRDVGLTMHLLGVTTLVPFLKDAKAALRYFREPRTGNGNTSGYYDRLLEKKGVKKGEKRVRYRIPLRRRARTGPKTSSVLMVVDRPDAFTDVMRMRLHEPSSGRFSIHTDFSSAIESLPETAPDLIVVDDRVQGSEDFLSQVKLERGRSLTSVIKLYPRGADLDRMKDFKIWENDFLREPFEVMELFRLCEAEIKRVPADREVFLHQVRFQFRSGEENVDRAKALVDDIVRKAGFNGDAALALRSAFKEAIDNAVVHGNHNDPAKSVDVVFVLREDRVTIQVEDEGPGFDYTAVLERLRDKDAFQKAKRRIIEKGKRGGLGILLIHKCMDQVEFLKSGNIIRMEKTLR
ncbi:MAG: ATP-binding protein [Planctomycetota bacterium]|nr:ATP-binding protein [Planctomycetota bacterium]